MITAGLRNALLDRLTGAPRVDWVAVTRGLIANQERDAIRALGGAAPTSPPGGPSLPLAAYAGRYRDPWFSDALVGTAEGRLTLELTKVLNGKTVLEPWGPNAFRTRFANGWEDAVLTFAVKNGAVTAITARPLSPLADFSYDYQDLAFEPVHREALI